MSQNKSSKPSGQMPCGDRYERYSEQNLWYPERLHMVEAEGGAIDSLSSESLYKHTEIGSAGAAPDILEAGGLTRVKVWFKCGKKPMPEGTELAFYVRGQTPLGVNFQDEDPGKENYISFHTQAGCKTARADNGKMGIKITEGSLREGDRVEMDLGGEAGYKCTPIAGRYELKAVVKYPDEQFERRLSEPVVITVKSRRFERYELLLPATAGRNEKIKLQITARDMFDNRAGLDKKVEFETPHEKGSLDLINGMGSCLIDRGKVEHFAVKIKEAGRQYVSNPCVIAEDDNLYIGDLHVHDLFSEAIGYTDDVYRWARDEKRLDFLSVAIQAHGWLDNQNWTVGKFFNERFLEEGSFVTFLANEWQHTGYGDKVIHFLGGDHPFAAVDDPRYDTPQKLYGFAKQTDAMIISHHPSYKAGSWCGSTDFSCIDTDVERVMEIWSMHGSSEGFDEDDRPLIGRDWERTAMQALKKGVRLGFVGGSDTHGGRPGGAVKEPRPYKGGLAAVWARSLTRRDIFKAIYDRRTYALTGARIVLKMWVNGEKMGSEIPFFKDVDIKVEAVGAGIIKKVQIMKNAELFREYDINDIRADINLSDKTEKAAFYHCRVVQADGHLAVCSPVWVG